MFVIIVYDIGEKRVAKGCKFLRRYMDWVQNSVFEGAVTERHLAEIEHGLGKFINKDEDSVRLYILRSEDAMKVKVMGIEKSDTCTII